ncbi:GAF domain-containing protein [Profundibacterium mesophilum]|nr:GAF domain-containing protein [Profundibacterium mesophilum]
MDTVVEPAKTFVEVAEIWTPEGDRLVLSGGVYGGHDRFAEASRAESFAKGEGLPGKAWAEARPVVLKEFDGSYFRRTEVAKEAGLTCAVAIPVFAGKALRAVLVVLCADDAERTGAIEVWSEAEGILKLADGYYGAARHFEWVSQHTQFPKGQGLPGAVWSAQTPILMRDLGSGYRFVRSESAGQAGLAIGLGVPIPVPGGKTFVLTLLSARGTPIARRFEIWDARAGKTAKMVDGICERDGPLWDPENAGRERVASVWEGPVGHALGGGVPVAETGAAANGYAMMVALPIHRGGELSHVVAWYC